MQLCFIGRDCVVKQLLASVLEHQNVKLPGMATLP